jgi:hypothetical protein
MDRAEFCAGLKGIQMLLREHQYLQYSPSGRGEYEQKLRNCGSQFAYLVFRKTGVPVRALPDTVPIDSVREPSYQAGRDLAARAAKRCRALAKTVYESQRGDYLACAQLWDKACEKLAEPEPGR